MTVHIDTSILIDALTGPRRSLDVLIRLTDQEHRLAVSTIVLYEWLRGPRTKSDLDAQDALLPGEHAIEFGAAEARLAAALFQQVRKPRGREIDLAIAATALAHGAAILTLNPGDFRDIPNLKML